MNISENTSLKHLNTFGIDVKAESLITCTSLVELEEGLNGVSQEDLLILGGGSNVLFMDDIKGRVLLNQISGMEVVEEDDKNVWIKAGSGVVWHEFVLNCIQNGYAGIENLSLIPGSVGAAPMQNIGAYGVEIKDVFHELSAVQIATGVSKTFSNKECAFGYRESVFKRALKGEYVISSVTFKLNKKTVFQTSYGAIQTELEKMKVKDLSIKAVSDAVISIRRSKLPDPAEIGNAGSFFKNPVIEKSLADQISKKYPELASYPAGENHMKLAAGWLIDKAGWKGKTFGKYGVHPKQALVLVNYGGATGKNIYDLSTEILLDIKQKFGVELEREVNVIG